MKAIVDNYIYVEGATAEVVKWCKEKLTLTNPDYEKKLRMGKWLGNTPEFIYLYQIDGNNIRLPFGCLQDFYSAFRNICEFKPSFSQLRPASYVGDINLYPYQEKAIAGAYSKRSGVIVMPCGSGKTQSALALIQKIGGKCLWLTHTTDLLNQSLKRAQSLMDADYGTITGGKVNIGNAITFATIQTMVNLDLAQYKDCWDIIVVDECHKAVGSPTKVMQFYKVLTNLSARYKYGLTATPKRSDGLEKSMYALLGNKIIEITKAEVKDTICPVEVRQIQTGWYPDCDAVLSGDGTVNYSELVDNLTGDEKRFNFIMDQLQNIPKGEAVMVLANRVAYLERMCAEYMDRHIGCAVCLSSMGNSKAAKERRKVSLEALNDGKISCIFATYQLAKEGLDVPNLRYIVFATPEKDETTVIQSAGRVARKHDGKEKGIVLDFVDSFGMLKGWANKRKNLFKKQDYEVIVDEKSITVS